MKPIQKLLLLTTLLLIVSCSREDEPSMISEPQLSNNKEVIKLTFVLNGNDYSSSINSTNISITNQLPFGTEQIEVENIEVSQKATTSLRNGDIINISSGTYHFDVRAENNSMTSYTVTAKFEEREYEVVPFDPVKVSKTNNLPTYAHYMPWFESPEYSEFGNSNFNNWGQHWTMSNVNPESGSVASHYTPLIGAYDNGEPHYCEYAVVCMKLSGLDGIMIDYSSQTDFYDWRMLHDHTLAIIPWLKKAGLKYSLVYEDNAARIGSENGLGTKKDLAASHFAYMQNNFFSDENYLKYNGFPVLMIFGPQSGITPEEWSDIVTNEVLVVLNGQAENQGINEIVAGEYPWSETEDALKSTYPYCNDRYELCIGSAMPGFEDYYMQGGWGETLLVIDPKNGQRFRDVLDIASQHDLDYLQVPTWNDWGEGTIIEPSLEFGYQRLEILQEWLGVEYDINDLELAVKLYEKRKEHKGKQYENQILDQVFYFLISLQIEEARELLNQI